MKTSHARLCELGNTQEFVRDPQRRNTDPANEMMPVDRSITSVSDDNLPLGFVAIK